jgi:hypothetical protein
VRDNDARPLVPLLRFGGAEDADAREGDPHMRDAENASMRVHTEGLAKVGRVIHYEA